uniref:Uncharacterized protein n=1 Tax=Anguilla anguilla TaxID=7936 RepID=A0A0E9SIT3_ANGAN
MWHVAHALTPKFLYFYSRVSS